MRAAAVPEGSRIRGEVAHSYFHDAFEMSLPATDKTALELYLSIVDGTPRWVDFLMASRNRIVAFLGLKNLGLLGGVDRNKGAASYRAGDRVGIFSILSLSDQEVVLGDTDKHLRAQISVYKEEGAPGKLIVSTVVHVNNFLGRAYLFFVVPVHKIIVPAMLGRVRGVVGGA